MAWIHVHTSIHVYGCMYVSVHVYVCACLHNINCDLKETGPLNNRIERCVTCKSRDRQRGNHIVVYLFVLCVVRSLDQKFFAICKLCRTPKVATCLESKFLVVGAPTAVQLQVQNYQQSGRFQKSVSNYAIAAKTKLETLLFLCTSWARTYLWPVSVCLSCRFPCKETMNRSDHGSFESLSTSTLVVPNRT